MICKRNAIVVIVWLNKQLYYNGNAWDPPENDRYTQMFRQSHICTSFSANSPDPHQDRVKHSQMLAQCTTVQSGTDNCVHELVAEMRTCCFNSKNINKNLLIEKQNYLYYDNYLLGLVRGWKIPSKYETLIVLIWFLQHDNLPNFEYWLLDRFCALSTHWVLWYLWH